MESQYAKSHSVDMDGEFKRWSAQLEAVEGGVNNLFGQVQILRNGRYIRTEQVYRKYAAFICFFSVTLVLSFQNILKNNNKSKRISFALDVFIRLEKVTL